MVPLFLEAKKQDKVAKLVVDKLIYNQRAYSYQYAQELAQMLQLYDKRLCKGNGYIAFHGRVSPFSSFFLSTTQEGGTKYNCSEQYYQHELCLYHGQPQATRSIMIQTDPVEMKRIGKKLSSQNVEREKQWLQTKAREVMKTAMYLKFTQNRALPDVLTNTTDAFVEANQHDRIWGLGFAITD